MTKIIVSDFLNHRVLWRSLGSLMGYLKNYNIKCDIGLIQKKEFLEISVFFGLYINNSDF
jgi:hypothetical protein